MLSSTTLAVSVLLALPCARAWGELGHATVATIANNYLNSAAKTYVEDLLGKDVSMASVASWADEYRLTAAGKFSAPFHFIDAEDSPPTTCSVDFSRDCTTKGCSISAIQNYTTRVQDTSLSAANRKQAMEFIIHFLGDITQPLHDEAEEVGGNDIAVTWDGEKTNLHSCWDTEMVEKLAGGENSTATVESFSNSLIAEIDNGKYASQKADWISCSDITTASDCATEWAQDANAINCQYVLQTDESGQELDGTYYTGAVPYIQLQISKGGYRLAAWLNALAAAAINADL